MQYQVSSKLTVKNKQTKKSRYHILPLTQLKVITLNATQLILELSSKTIQNHLILSGRSPKNW